MRDTLRARGFTFTLSLSAAERDAADRRPGSKAELLEPMRAVFDHVGRHRRFWGPLSRKGGADLVTRILHQSVSDLVREHLRSRFPDTQADQTQLEATIQFVTGACMGLVTWWLENDAVPYSAEELQAIFRQLATKGVRRFLTT